MLKASRKAGDVGMKVIQTWTRNTPSSAGGYSITVNITYSSNILSEIEEVEKKLPRGMLVMDSDKTERMYPLEQEGR